MASFFQLLFSGLEIGSIYALATLGIMLIFRTSSVTNFAQGIIGMFNAFFVSAFIMGAFDIVVEVADGVIVYPDNTRWIHAILIGLLIATIVYHIMKYKGTSGKIRWIAFGFALLISTLLAWVGLRPVWVSIVSWAIENWDSRVFETGNIVRYLFVDSTRMLVATVVGLGVGWILAKLLIKRKHPIAASYVIGTLVAYMFIMIHWLLGGSIWSAAILGLFSAFLTGIVIDFIIIRRAQKVYSLAKQIITMGLVIVFLGITPMIFDKMLIGADPVRIPRFIPEGAINLSGASLSYNALFNITVGLIIMIGLFLFLQKTRWGLAVRVTAANPQTAKMMGVPTKLVTVGSWAVAAMLGTLAAIMYAPTVGILTPGFMTVIQIVAFVACVFGGFQTFHGPVIAAYILAVVRNLLIFYGTSFFQIFFGETIPGDFGSIWGEQILYVLIIVFIIFRPFGLVGKKVIKKV